MTIKNSYTIKERMQNKVLHDEIGIIMGEGGFKPKRELFKLKLGIIVNKDGWENNVETALKEVVKKSDINILISKADINYQLDMNDRTPLDSWIYEVNYIIGNKFGQEYMWITLGNIYNNVITKYQISFDKEIFDSVDKVVRMWCDDIDEAKDIQFRISQLEKTRHIYPKNGDEILKLQYELDSFYDDGEGTDDYYNFLIKKKYVRNVADKYLKKVIADEMELAYVRKGIALQEGIRYLHERKAKNDYWLMNHMRTEGIEFMCTENMVPFTVKNQNRGVYFLKDSKGFRLDFKKVSYRPNMRELKNKLDEAFV